MNAGEAFVEKFLAHYASEYYDPAKAREYYLRTRELKGRQSTGALTVKGDKAGNEERKQAWAYTKNQIGLAKKADLQAASEERKNFVERLRQMASQKRQEISDQLNSLLEAITQQRSDLSEEISADKEYALQQQAAQQKARLDQLRKKAESKIDALPKIPEGIGDAQRARLVAQREQKIARIRGTLNSDLKKVIDEGATERQAISEATADDYEVLSAYTQGRRQEERESASVSREAVTTELKASVDKARADYEALKERITAEYEETSQREFDEIRGNLPSAPSSSSSSKSSGKKTGGKNDKPSSKPGRKKNVKSISLQEAAEEFVRRQNSK